jgi:hypothetical protein
MYKKKKKWQKVRKEQRFMHSNENITRRTEKRYSIAFALLEK